jgi:hypothetical protein
MKIIYTHLSKKMIFRKHIERIFMATALQEKKLLI